MLHPPQLILVDLIDEKAEFPASARMIWQFFNKSHRTNCHYSAIMSAFDDTCKSQQINATWNAVIHCLKSIDGCQSKLWDALRSSIKKHILCKNPKCGLISLKPKEEYPVDTLKYLWEPGDFAGVRVSFEELVSDALSTTLGQTQAPGAGDACDWCGAKNEKVVRFTATARGARFSAVRKTRWSA